MKYNKTILVLTCSAAIAVTSMSALAQTASDTTPSNTTNRMTESSTYREENRPNYSWLGLIGLAGLVGLRRRNEDSNPTDHRTIHNRN